MEAVKTEAIEGELDRIIERRSKDRDDEQQAIESLWKDSARRETMKRREMNRWLWIRHFEAVAACLRERAEEFDGKAKELQEGRAHE